MSKFHFGIVFILLSIFFYSCERESAPTDLPGFSEGEYYGTFESVIEDSSSVYAILHRGDIEFYFVNSTFYYQGVIKYSYDDIYPQNIRAQGVYDFQQDTIVFVESYTPIDSIKPASINLIPFFTCEYAGHVMYLTKHYNNEKLTIVLRKR